MSTPVSYCAHRRGYRITHREAQPIRRSSSQDWPEVFENTDDEADENAAEYDLKPCPIYSEDDDIWRCSDCCWEIVDGVCQNQDCCLEHDMTETEEDMDVCDSFDVSQTHLDLLDEEGQFAPRGTSPPPTALVDVPEKPAYLKSTRMYHELLSRGATAAMCARYHMQFSPQIGIIAWADGDLFDDFTGDAILEGDRWYICLGRRIKLEPDDHDGQAFMTDIVEEATFRLSSTGARWETLLTYQGQEQERVWMTQPRASGFNCFYIPYGMDDGGDDEDSDETEDSDTDAGLEMHPYRTSKLLFVDEYDSDSDEEDEGMDVDPNYDPDANSDDFPERAPSKELPPACASDVKEEMSSSDAVDSDGASSDWDVDEETLSGDEQILESYQVELRASSVEV